MPFQLQLQSEITLSESTYRASGPNFQAWWIRSIGLWLWHINIRVIITILDIIHCPVFYLKHNVSRLDSVPIFRWNLLRWAVDKASLCLWTPATTPIWCGDSLESSLVRQIGYLEVSAAFSLKVYYGVVSVNVYHSYFHVFPKSIIHTTLGNYL
jgi:hypothetical protein